MNYPYPTSSPYMHAAMSHALQAIMSGPPLPPNCVLMAMPIQQAQQILPQLMMNAPYYGQRMPYKKNSRTPPNYNYPVVSYKNQKKKPAATGQPHPNIYNSSSFDSYMRHLSWSRLFDRRSTRKTGKQPTPPIPDPLKTPRLNSSTSSSSSSSTTTDETIRRVNVMNKQPVNLDLKQPIKGTLPFKYSSEFLPGLGKQQQKIKSNDVFFIKKQ